MTLPSRSVLSRFNPAFSYQAGSWNKKRRVVAKVEWHPGELYPRVGFIVTNLSRPAERVTRFYDGRGTAEQYIKEGKNAINWTRVRRVCARPLDGRSRLTLPWLSQQRAASSASRPGLQSRQLHADAGVAEGGGALVAHDTAGLSGNADQGSLRSAPRSCVMVATSLSRWRRSPSQDLCSPISSPD